MIAIVDDEMRELAIPNVARTPSPSCVLIAFEEGNLRYQLRYFLTDLARGRPHRLDGARAPVRLAAARRHPHRRAAAHHARGAARRGARRDRAPARADAPPGDARQRRHRSPRCPTRTKAEIAERLQYAPFARGDVITKQGNTAHWLYIVAFGEAEVLLRAAARRAAACIGTVHAGQFFGEMALLTGDARTATVVAKTDVECYRLDRASFQELLLVAPRDRRGDQARHGRRAAATSTRRARPSPTRARRSEARCDLPTKIRRFFGMRRIQTT